MRMRALSVILAVLISGCVTRVQPAIPSDAAAAEPAVVEPANILYSRKDLDYTKRVISKETPRLRWCGEGFYATCPPAGIVDATPLMLDPARDIDPKMAALLYRSMADNVTRRCRDACWCARQGPVLLLDEGAPLIVPLFRGTKVITSGFIECSCDQRTTTAFHTLPIP